MQYKTVILELLKQRPKMHEQLRKDRKLLMTMEQFAKELRTSHLAWQDLLSELRPGSDKSQIGSEALEIAMKELEDRLQTESPRKEHEELSIDAAMLFLRHRHTPRG
jgi:hypothetical protein